LVLAGSVAGCLTANPALTDSSGETEGDDGSTGSDTSGSPTTNPSTTAGPTSSTDPSTTDGTTVDPDTTVGPDTDDPTTDTETTGPAACGTGNVCAPEVPAGWAGPVVWAETATEDPQPACPEAYAELAFNAFDDLQAPPAECTCECGEPSGVNCAAISLELHGSDSSCIGAPDDTFTISASGACNNGPASSGGRYWEVADPGISGGECSVMDSVRVPAAGFGETSTVCTGASVDGGECAGSDTCVPVPPKGFEPRLCIWQQGDVECPAGGYEDRFVRHAEFSDDRNCTTCTCGDPEGDCAGTVRLWTSGSCSPTSAGNISIGAGCTVSVGSTQGASAVNLTVEDASCAPSGGVPSGEAEPDDPYTLCCMSV
jgi:hypothetical protein